jgi:hypothetical protein
MKTILLLIAVFYLCSCSSTKYQKVEMFGCDKNGKYGIHTYKKPIPKTHKMTPISHYDSMQKLKSIYPNNIKY